MKLSQSLAAITMCFFLAACGQNATAAKGEDAPQQLIKATADQQQNLQRHLNTMADGKEVKIKLIKPSNHANIFEVLLDSGDFFYTDAGGNLLITGDIYDMNKRLSLSQATIIENLDLTKALKVVSGNGQRKLIVFADPNCSYCKKLEKDLATIDNLTTYIFLVPILGEKSIGDVRNILCSKQPVKVWSDWMLKEVPIPEGNKCNDKQIVEQVSYARNMFVGLQFSGTPGIIFSKDDVARGYMPKDKLEAKLAQQKGAAK